MIKYEFKTHFCTKNLDVPAQRCRFRRVDLFWVKAFQKCLPVLHSFHTSPPLFNCFLQQNEFSTHMEDMQTAEFNEFNFAFQHIVN